MLRKLSIFITLIVLVLSLVGCGTWEAYDTGVDVTGTPAPEAAVEVDTPTPVEPADVEAVPVETGGLDTLLNFLLNLTGLIPVVAGGVFPIAFIVDLLKRLPKPFKLADGYAPLASGILNLALFAAFFFLNDKQDEILNGALAAFATLSPFLLMLFISMIGTSGAHNRLEDHGLGYSHTGQAIKGMVRAG